MHRPQKAEDEAGKRLLLDNLLGLAGDHQLLIGGDDQHAHIAAPAGDVAHVAVAVLVLVHIDADAQEVQTLADGLTQLSVMLADAAGEDDGVGAAEEEVVAADVVDEAVEDLKLIVF